jgi:hypothetical protein
MDNVQNCDSYINLPSSQIMSHIFFLATIICCTVWQYCAGSPGFQLRFLKLRTVLLQYVFGYRCRKVRTFLLGLEDIS